MLNITSLKYSLHKFRELAKLRIPIQLLKQLRSIPQNKKVTGLKSELYSLMWPVCSLP